MIDELLVHTHVIVVFACIDLNAQSFSRSLRYPNECSDAY